MIPSTEDFTTCFCCDEARPIRLVVITDAGEPVPLCDACCNLDTASLIERLAPKSVFAERIAAFVTFTRVFARRIRLMDYARWN